MKRNFWLALPVGLLGVFLYKMRSELLGIFAVLAYMTAFSLLLLPLCRKLESRGLRPAWAAGCAVIGLFMMLLITLSALIPYFVSRSFYLFKRIAPTAAQMMGEWKGWAESNVFVQSALSGSGGMLAESISGVTAKLARAGMTAAAQLGKIGFALVLTYYVLCDRQRIGNHLFLFVPMRWRNPTAAGLLACRNAMMSYFSGLIKTSLFVSCATYAGLLILGIQDALLLSVIMGMLEVLPYLGPVLASMPILLSAMTQGTDTMLLALVMLVLIQQIEGNIISPYFTASSTSIHPLAAVIGVFVSGSLFGVWGILIAVPALVLVQSIGWSWVQTKRIIDGID